MSAAAAADRLWQAAITHTPCAPVRDLIDANDVDAAYVAQQHNVDRIVAERGWRICGRKIGLTSVVVQQQLGVDQPDFGALFAELAHGDGQVVPMDDLLQPRIEAEVALVLDADLAKGRHTVADILGATAFALPALEIVDSRIAGWDITFVDTVADNASSGRFVLGTVPVALGGLGGSSGLDLAAITMSMTINGVERSTGRGAACLGNPLFAAGWLADTMCALGSPLRAGDVVMTGALGPMVDVVAGDEVVAVIEGLGRVSTSFGEKDT